MGFHISGLNATCPCAMNYLKLFYFIYLINHFIDFFYATRPYVMPQN